LQQLVWRELLKQVQQLWWRSLVTTKFYSCVDESVGEELSDVAAVVAGQCFVHEMCDGTTLIGKSTNTFDDAHQFR